MFHRSGTQNKFEIRAPPNDLANKLKLQHPPPALLLSEQPASAKSKQPVHRNRSHPIVDGKSDSVEVRRNRPPSNKQSHDTTSDKRKKKNVFSFLKKSKDKEGPSPQRSMSRTPEGFGRKYVNYDHPDSVPPIRRPHSSASNRHNGVTITNPQRSLRERKYGPFDSEDDSDDLIGYRRQIKPIRIAPPIPIPSTTGNNGGYDSLDKFRNLRLSQSDEGSLISSIPSTSLSSNETSVPGLIGIKNHGNTCFMNSIIQCLSNTEPLLHYFLTDDYKRDLSISKKNRQKLQPIVSPTNGIINQSDVLTPSSDGAVTEYLGLLIKSLWNAQYEPRVSAFVRDVIGLWGQQYRGANQHDAQEFLLWILDHLHENLNQATGELIIRSPSRKSDEEELAAETLSDHLQRHDSVIYNLFSAQYHSSLRCPGCNHLSNTFDPYLCISLSVPRRGSRPIYITMARRHQNTTRLMVFAMSLKVNATVRDIQRQLSIEARTLPHYLVISDMKQDGFYRFFRPNDPISAIGEYSVMFAYEVTPYKGEFTPSLPHPGSIMGAGGETIFVILQCRVGQGEYSKRFGSPMCLRVWRDLTYSQLQSVVFRQMRQYLHDQVNPEVVCRDYIFFKCLVLDGLQDQEYLDPYCSAPFMCPSVEKALSVSKLWGYEPHIKIIAEWEQWVKDTVCSDIPDSSEDPIHPSVQQIRDHYNTPLEANLDDCLEWHTKDEKLDDDETYRCYHCSKPQAGATKKISFWTLPDILVIHLKRFELDEYSQSKLNTIIKYPVRGLDMTPYIARPEQKRPSSAMGFRHHVMTTTSSPIKSGGSVREKKSKLSLEKQNSSNTLPLKGVGFEDLRKTDHALPKSKQKFVWKKSKKPKKSSESTEPPVVQSNVAKDSNLYDLYALCNHHGNMDSGHYISQCCNPVDGRWYTYDDHRVIPLANTDQLITQYAYVLFYLRRGAKIQYSLTSEVSGEDHWVQKLIHFKMDLSRFIPSQAEISKAQRQGSVASAKTLSMGSGVSSDNMTVMSPPGHSVMSSPGHPVMSSPGHPPPLPIYHSHQLSNESTGYGPVSPPQSVTGYTHSLPSPSAHSSVSYFSQSSQPFTKRVGSYHGNTTNRTATRL